MYVHIKTNGHKSLADSKLKNPCVMLLQHVKCAKIGVLSRRDRQYECGYGRTSCESNGLIPDFMSMFASTKYLRHAKRLRRERGGVRKVEMRREREREGGSEGGRNEGRERGGEGGRNEGRERGSEGGRNEERERGSEGGRNEGRERGSEGDRNEGREGE